MDSKDFLDNLILRFDSQQNDVTNLRFSKDKNQLLNSLSHFDEQKKIICLSSTYFNKNLDLIATIKDVNYLQAIISLPIYHDDDNLIVIIFDSSKTDDKCLFIDESDSLIHRDDSVDWTYAGEELINEITDIYEKFIETDNSVVLNIHDIFPGNQKMEVSDELLSLKSSSNDDLPIRRRVISDEIADELLALKEKKSVSEEISRHDIKSFENHSRKNIPFLNDAMYLKRRQNPKNLLYKNERRLIDEEVQFRKLGKIADLHNIYFKNDNDSILIATCKGCSSKLVFYNKDVTDFKGEVYIELINVVDSVSIEYLYEYLSSSNGLDELLYFSKGSNFINPEDIKNVKIPVPPLEIQKEIVKVVRESKEFFRSVDLLKREFDSNILDYKHMEKSLNEFKGEIAFDGETNEVTTLSRNWRHAYKGLIWPLAISYLSATKGGFETVEKKDNYLVLFEFIAAFNSVVLLSGLPDDVYQSNFSKIWNAYDFKEYRMMTFANWVYLSKNLSKVYRFNNFTSKLDGEFFDNLIDDKLLSMLEDAKNLRNEEHHGPHSNAYEAKEIVEKLDIYLEDVFDILEVYSKYKLIYVTGDIISNEDPYCHRVILLNGPCAQPIYEKIIFDKMLKEKSLYLYNPRNNKKLLLKDNLIKFRPVDKNKKRWALFIYHSCDRRENNAFYKCFQSKESDIKESIFSLEKNILSKK